MPSASLGILAVMILGLRPTGDRDGLGPQDLEDLVPHGLPRTLSSRAARGGASKGYIGSCRIVTLRRWHDVTLTPFRGSRQLVLSFDRTVKTIICNENVEHCWIARVVASIFASSMGGSRGLAPSVLPCPCTSLGASLLDRALTPPGPLGRAPAPRALQRCLPGRSTPGACGSQRPNACCSRKRFAACFVALRATCSRGSLPPR